MWEDHYTMKGIIYKATSPSGKVYIGQTTCTLDKRKRGHFHKAFNKNAVTYNTKFAKAIRKYGPDAFAWTILYDNTPQENLSKLEKKEVFEHNSYYEGYNSTRGGKGSTGVKFSDEARKNISESKRGANNPKAKLNWIKVKQIRKLFKQGKRAPYLSKRFKVSRGAIYDITKNKTWIE